MRYCSHATGFQINTWIIKVLCVYNLRCTANKIRNQQGPKQKKDQAERSNNGVIESKRVGLWGSIKRMMKKNWTYLRTRLVKEKVLGGIGKGTHIMDPFKFFLQKTLQHCTPSVWLNSHSPMPWMNELHIYIKVHLSYLLDLCSNFVPTWNFLIYGSSLSGEQNN